MPDAVIRPARVDETTAVVRCYDWLFAPPGACPPEWSPTTASVRLRALIDSDRNTVLVAGTGGALIGFATVSLTLVSVRFGRRAWVEDLAVDPDHRGRGIGRRLLDAARDWARDQGADWLGLESGLGRLDAHRFYERERPDAMARSFAWRL